jgi:hypothetical protein
MKRFIYLPMLLAVPAVALMSLGFSGCSTPPPKVKPPTDTSKQKDGAEDKSGKGAETKTEPLSAKLDAVVKGKVVFDGTPPTMAEIKPMHDHADKNVCLQGPRTDQTWLVAKDGGVANVIVYLEPPSGKSFGIDEALAKKHNADAVIDQPYCVFEPQVVAMFPSYRADGKSHETGQKLRVKNSSTLSHNTKIAVDERRNTPFNKNIEPGDKEGIPVTIKYQKDVLAVGCDKHTWMTATIKTFENPYFAVTKEDGSFEIKDVPSGVELTVKVWHKAVGTGPEQKKTFTTGDNDLPPLKIKATS